MVSKDLFTGLTVFALVVSVTTAVFVLINFGNIIHLTSVNNPRPVMDTACSSEPDNTCKYGLQHLATSGSSTIRYCTTEQRRVGETCTSDCHNSSADGDLVCDSNGTCVGTTPEKCLGYCNMSADTEYTFDYDHPDCSGKLTVSPYFYWNDVGSSTTIANQLFYSDDAAYCELGVCMSYAVVVDVHNQVLGNSGTIFDTIHGIIKDPLFYLNNTNKACITYNIQVLDTNFTTQTFRNLYWEDDAIPTAIVMGRMIRYFYSCSAITESLLSAEGLVTAGAKRATMAMTKPSAHAMFTNMVSGENVPKIKALMKNSKR